MTLHSKNNSQHSLLRLKREIEAWDAHIEKLGLEDRREFVDWLSQSLIKKEFALLIDGEVNRQSLWQTYLEERYGP